MVKLQANRYDKLEHSKRIQEFLAQQFGLMEQEGVKNASGEIDFSKIDFSKGSVA